MALLPMNPFRRIGPAPMRRALRICLVILLAGSVPFDLRGQDLRISLPFKVYDVSSGLPQMQVRSLFVDRDGLVWIGTQGGLAVYDGQQVRTIGEQGPLREEYILNLVRGSEGLLVSALDETYTFDGKRLMTLSMAGNVPGAIIWFEDPRGWVWILNSSTWSPFLSRNGTTRQIGEVYPALAGISVFLAWGDPNWAKCYLLDWDKRFYVLDPASGQVAIDSTTFSPSDSLESWSPQTAVPGSIVIERRKSRNGSPLETTDLFVIREDRLVSATRPGSIDGRLHAIIPKAPLAYRGQENGTETLFILRDSVYQPFILPRFENLKFLTTDDRKIYIGSDFGFGMIHADGLETIDYPACDYAWSVVPGRGGDIYLGCYKSGIHHLGADGRLIRHYPPPGLLTGSDQGDQVLSNFLDTPSAYCWGSNHGFLKLDKKTSRLSLPTTQYSVEAMAIDPLTGAIIAGSNKIYWYNPVSGEKADSLTMEESILAGGYVNDLEVTDGRYLWIAAPGGIVRVNLHDRQMIVFSGKNGTLPCRGGVTLTSDRFGNLWSGGTCGLMVHEKGSLLFIPVLPGMITERINQVNILPDGRVICAGANNLFVLKKDRGRMALQYAYNSKNGFALFEPSENGSSIVANRYAWLPSATAIQRLDLSRIPEKFLPASLILERMNDEPVAFLARGYDSLRVSLSSALLDFLLVDPGGRNWKFQFLLNGAPASPWQSSSEILVSGLCHGKNTILVRAAWDPSDPNTYIEMPVNIIASLPLAARHQVQQGFAVMLVVLIGLVAIIAGVARRKTREAHELHRRLDINQLRAIQSYFSPHFFFNLMANIQGRILHNDKEVSNSMLVKISNLFRQILYWGRDGRSGPVFIRLSQELGIIQDIVFLNNKLLDAPVEFIPDIPDSLRAEDPKIPPMLIEPFIENAFKHAFTEKMLDKWVSLSIREEENDLVILIRDNGVGMDEKKPSFATGTSSGMRLARERMEILNKLHVPNSLSILPNEPRGTRIEIRLQKSLP